MPFDRIVVVDWSAGSTPRLGRDSIWIAEHDDVSPAVCNVPTRAAAADHLRRIIDESAGASALIAVDFSLGYPSGTAAALGVGGPAWRGTWNLLTEMIHDDEANRNNRFEVAAALNSRMSGGPRPFWGCPVSRSAPTLTTGKPGRADLDAHGLPGEWRVVEQQLRAAGRRPFSSWQLLGAGAVGSQTLLGIPLFEGLRRAAPDRVQIWPFTTGLGLHVDRGSVVVAEVWPSLLDVDRDLHPVVDACQVHTAASWLARHRDAGTLPHLFSPVVPGPALASVVEEEGWVLGVGCEPPDTLGR